LSSIARRAQPLSLMAPLIAVDAPESNLEGGNVGFLGHDEDVQPRRCMVPVPKFMKKLRRPAAFGGEADFLDIPGMDPIEAISADWSDALVGQGGVLCNSAPVYFDVGNASGTAAWGPTARGTAVVAMRGLASFEEMVVNAASSGAVALIIIDNEPDFKNDYVITMDTEGAKAPSIPAVIVPKQHSECLCSGRASLTAAISRRQTKLSAREIARNVLAVYAAAWPF